ncbi:helix-turn-helix domain-containing protein [Pseudomonas syringae pv. syringae]|uniref:helix-turn-helix domain-containing protein n=1 Tax=Pseudomonas syringae TaxID=317 RepID=UPI00200B542D|nr:helix-turn-helix transcriptional regulator [Pseudomonas syringae]MCK9759902.1 helix-turn-helix domain-containing protein [Pseudomonas syringae pv. syringae]MCK9774893.1 helix-turn-helix domain-containing protein [Pseudomonas syringae pv. syringae]
MDQVREILAARLKRLRTSKGMKQAELAEAAGLDVNTLSRYERAQQMPGIEQLLNLARGLGVSPMDILPHADALAQRLQLLRQELNDKASQLESPKSLEELIAVADECIQMEKGR